MSETSDRSTNRSAASIAANVATALFAIVIVLQILLADGAYPGLKIGQCGRRGHPGFICLRDPPPRGSHRRSAPLNGD